CVPPSPIGTSPFIAWHEVQPAESDRKMSRPRATFASSTAAGVRCGAFIRARYVSSAYLLRSSIPAPPRRCSVLTRCSRTVLLAAVQPNGAVSERRPASIGVCRGPSGLAHVNPSSRPSGWQLAQARPSEEILEDPEA